MSTIDELRKVRIEKVEKLHDMGIDPYPARCQRKNTAAEARDLVGKEASVAGRIMAIRGHGGIRFIDLKDESGKIQLVFKADNLSDKLKGLLDLLDIGDFIDASGEIFKTVVGEISVNVIDFHILTKSIRPLPDKWYGFKDEEDKYRKRYLDLLMNVGSKNILDKRSKIVFALRKFLIEKKGYVEIEDPVLQPLYGGTRARPFKTHHNTLNMDIYLRISNELYLKRLIVAGFEKVFEIGHTFRNEGMDKNHNPEFTMLETMEAYADYRKNMELIEEMFEYVATEVFGTTELPFQEKMISYKRPWARVKLADLFKKYTKTSIEEIDSTEKAVALAKQMKVEVKSFMTVGEMVLEIFEKACTKELVQPTFVYDYPVEFLPLAKQCRDNPKMVESFDIYLVGLEMGTNYSEQNDPRALRKAWEEEKEKSQAGNPEAQILDEDFIEALEYGMPPTSGIGPGIDRWVMIMTDTPSIRDAIAFPLLKPPSK